MNIITTIASSLLITTTLALAACSDSDGPSQSPQASAAAAPAWLLTAEPADAKGIVELKASASEGDTVVLRGIIGGTVEPLTAGSPVFRVVDTTMFNRCTTEDDHCSTPWDYCCAPREALVANSATVQLVDESGAAIVGSPVDAGLAGLDEVVVVGTVAARPSQDVLTVKAIGVYRVGG